MIFISTIQRDEYEWTKEENIYLEYNPRIRQIHDPIFRILFYPLANRSLPVVSFTRRSTRHVETFNRRRFGGNNINYSVDKTLRRDTMRCTLCVVGLNSLYAFYFSN